MAGSVHLATVARALLLAFGAGLVLHLAHGAEHEQHEISPLLHWLRDSALSTPLALTSAVVGDLAGRRASGRLRNGTVGGATAALDGAARLSTLLATALCYSVLSVPGNLVHGWVFVGDAHPEHEAVSGVPHLLADGSLALGSATATLLLGLLITISWPTLRRPSLRPTGGAVDPRARRRRLAAAVTFAPLATALLTPLAVAGPAQGVEPPSGSCVAQTAQRSYDVAAISVPIPYNRFGDLDPNGMAYVYEQDRKAVENWYRPLASDAANDPADNRRLRPRPLVIRANEGECVEVTFTNRLDKVALDGGAVTEPRASMYVSGAATSAMSQGAQVGYNEDTTVARGRSITYYWRAPRQEGLHLIRDMAMSAGGEADGGSVSHGLWGGLAVEPAGSRWFDSHSGLPLYPVSSVAAMSGELYLDADVRLPSGTYFRESVQISQDEIPGVGFGFNYGADAQENRDKKRCPDCVGEETSLSSWTYGDPAAVKLASGLPGTAGWTVGPDTDPEDCQSDDAVARPAMMMPPGVPGGCWTSNVTHANKQDPTKIRVAHAGVKETHVFHMHANQWLAEPQDVGTAGSNPTRPSDQKRPESTTVDSQTYGPGDAFTVDLLFGAGSKAGTVGDSIFHCHLYPHFAGGFWSLLRVHDVVEDGTLKTPDGVRTRLLTVLPDRKAAGDVPSAYDAKTNPGYPRFIPGRFGWRAPQPPAAVSEPDGTPGVRMVAGQGLVPELMNQVQDVEATIPTGGAVTGSFTLGYRDEVTTDLPASASAAQVESALEALASIGDVAVTSTGASGTAWRVTFADPATNVRALTSASDQVRISSVDDVWRQALATERAAQQRAFAGTGTGPKPGAPFTDPCPSTAREVTYNVSVLQRDLVYNDDGWHDPQGRLLVLSKDVPAIMAGTKKAEPLFFRASAGDCINFNLTNLLPNWYGNDAFQVLQQTNMFGQHIHLVKFDVLGSDGSSNGWNYQQAAFTDLQSAFNKAVIDGSRQCTTDEAQGACRLPLPGPDGYDPLKQGIHPGQTIHERWYADYELRTVFSHDHHFPAVDQGRGLFGGLIVEPRGMDFRSSRTGKYHQPVTDSAHGPVCGPRCEGDAAGALFDVIGPGSKDDFREFGLGFQDFVPLMRAGGDPKDPADAFNPPPAPETFADDDPGVMGVNYRNEPFLIRDTVNGKRTDPAYVFSSTLHGDPATPLLEAYAGDPVRIRLVAGSQEEQHVFGLHGLRWREEPDDPESPYTSAKSLGVSEAFNFEIPEMDCAANTDCRGDYLYSSTATDDAYLGMWGLMRVYGKGKQGLVPLPDNTPQAANGVINTPVTGAPPAPANKPGNPCPAGAPIRAFTVAATDARIDYNRQGDHDPYGLVYVAVEPGESVVDAVARARAHPEPMSLRANENDCIEVRLHNRIDPAGPYATRHAPLGAADGDPRLPLEPPTGTPAGLRVSLHPQLLKYDVRGSDGATVGFNRDQSVAPGSDILYRWYADDVAPGELGALNLTDYGDVRGHRHHGLFAGLTVEPKGATYHDPITGEQVVSGEAADVRVPGRADFRDFTSFFQDGLNLRDKDGALVPDGFAHPPAPGEAPAELDSEDKGEKGFNYASAPFRHRLGITPMAATATSPMLGSDLAGVLSSQRHGDPDTPVFRAYAGDAVRFRVLQGADKPRQHTFTVSGHSWRAQPDDPGSNRVGAQGGLSVDRAANIELDSAGNGTRGDYLYADPLGFHHLSGGAWGILRAYRAPTADPVYDPSPLGTGTATGPDSPFRDGYGPILPLEQARVTVSLFDDTDMNGVRGPGERRGPDQEVTLTTTDGTNRSVTRRVGPDGSVTFWVPRGAYDVRAAAPTDWRLTTATTTRVDVSAENSAEPVPIGMVQLADVGVRLFRDQDGSSTRQPAEGPLAGWVVSLGKGTEKLTATTDDTGLASFEGLVPGDWSLTSPGQAGWHATRALPAIVPVTENQTRSVDNETLLGFTMPAGLSVKVFNDADGNGTQQAGESSQAGWKVTAKGGPPERQVRVTAVTDAQGVVSFEDPDPLVTGLTPGSYTLSVATPENWRLGTPSALTTGGPAGSTTATATPGFTCGATYCTTVLVEKSAQVATLPVRNPYSWLTGTPFTDLNNDGTKQDKEPRLTGWQVTATSSTGAVTQVESGNDGRAVFYPMAPGSYTLEMISPEPSIDPNILDWTATNRTGCSDYASGRKICRARVDVIAGENGSAGFGFVQLGTVGVTTFHDYDKDGVRDDNEPLQPDRTVKLFDATGKTLLQQKVTDAQGLAAFKTSAGVKYQVQAMLPTGWVQTSPVDSRNVALTKVAVVGPTGTTSVGVEIAQYNTADSIAPPVPTSSVAAGTYSTAQQVQLTSESGASIWYTLSGAAPGAATGQLYTGPVTLSSSHLLRAIAVDGAGNVSAELSSDPSSSVSSAGLPIEVVLTGTTAAVQAPASWKVTTGGVPTPPSGLTEAQSLALDDSQRLLLPSVYVTKTKLYTVDGYASVVLPSGQRNVAALGVDLDGRATLTGTTRSMWLYDFKAAAWVSLINAQSQPITDLRSVVDASGDPARFVSGTGEVRVRYSAVRSSGAFDSRLDQVLVRMAYR